MTTTAAPPSTTRQRPTSRRIVRAILIGLAAVVGGLLLLVVVLGLLPIRAPEPPAANPAVGYEEAVARYEAILASENALTDLNPECHSVLLTHGQPTAEVLILFHGFTSCPRQYLELGQALFERGHNVYIPLAPYHGRLDRRGTALTDLTVEDLQAYAMDSADIAQGLGERVVVSGLSGGGVIAASLGQQRSDVDTAVPMAPIVGVSFVPGVFLNKGLTNLIAVVPNFYRWWDPVTKDKNPNTAPYSYLGHPVHALGDYMRLGFADLAAAARTPQAARTTIMVINPHETSVSNAVARDLQRAWAALSPGNAGLFEMPGEPRLAHDFVTATRPGNDPATIYPVLIGLLSSEP